MEQEVSLLEISRGLVEGTTAPDWINAFAAAIGAIAIVIGLIGANRKINETQRSARALRRSQIAEELIATVHNVADSFNYVRNPFGSIPKEKLNDKHYSYQERHNRLAEFNELFKELREAQIRVRAVIGDDEVEAAVESLFRARHSVSVAIKMLADMVDDDPPFDDEMRGLIRRLRADMYSSSSDEDEISTVIAKAIETVEDNLSPIARLEMRQK
jgi:hypothetical protein